MHCCVHQEAKGRKRKAHHRKSKTNTSATSQEKGVRLSRLCFSYKLLLIFLCEGRAVAPLRRCGWGASRTPFITSMLKGKLGGLLKKGAAAAGVPLKQEQELQHQGLQWRAAVQAAKTKKEELAWALRLR